MKAKRKPLPRNMAGRELVAWNVRRLRVERDLSAEALANQSGVDRVYLSRMGVEIAQLFAVPSRNDRPPEPLPGGRRSRQ
jgi:hypothetical protein